MNLKNLSSSVLLNQVEKLVREERRISIEVLHHLMEIELRKAYGSLGYRSLFDYAVKHLKYSEGAASRRISAMYALKKTPELESKLAAGTLNVSNVARVESFIRKEEKLSGARMPQSEKRRIFLQSEGLSQQALESRLVEISPRAAIRDVTRPFMPGLHEMRLQITTEDLAKWQELKGWQASTAETGTDSELLSRVLDLARVNYIDRRMSQPGSQRDASPLTGSNRRAYSSTTSSRSIPRELSRIIYARAQMKCEHINTDTRERCGSNHRLEIHHRVPFARGGKHSAENLQLLCRDHNFLEGVRVFGWKRMRVGV